jgi:hypothetical protein
VRTRRRFLKYIIVYISRVLLVNIDLFCKIEQSIGFHYMEHTVFAVGRRPDYGSYGLKRKPTDAE